MSFIDLTSHIVFIDAFDRTPFDDVNLPLGEANGREQSGDMRNLNQRVFALIGAIVALLLMLGTVPAANAAPSKAPDKSDPGLVQHLDQVNKKIAAAGKGKILGTTVSEYSPEDTTSPVLMAFPSGCRLYVTLYFTYRSSSQSSVYNESSNYCPGATGSSLDMTIKKRDTVWGTVSVVASAWGGWSGEAEYRCPTGNISDFRAETWGQVVYGGVRYTASAYDGDANSGYYRYSCG